jgi:tight adherence protein C
VSGALAGAAVLLAFAAAWQIAGEHGELLRVRARAAAGALTAGRARSLAEAALALGVPERLARAGLADRIPAVGLVVAKACGAAVGASCALAVAPSLPGRLDVVAAPLLALAGFLGPDAYLERAARLRHQQLVAALPDALDLLAVAAGTGRGVVAGMTELARQGTGPLAAELAMTVAEIECGANQGDALAALRRRVPGVEVGALAAALERSRRYGSPLAEQLHAQAAALRSEGRRRTEERAARAAPKIQLVVALVLVPSVLLMILAAIIAHSDALFGAVS